ncbi:MAG: AraC family transcriptional regulator [Sphingobium sp.]
MSFSDLLLSLRGYAAQPGFVRFDPEQVRLRFPRSRRTCFHLVLGGETPVTLHQGGEIRSLRAGDLALFVHGDGHDLGQTAADAVPLPESFFSQADEPAQLEICEGPTRILTGYLGLEDMGEAVATGGLPTLLVKSFADEPALNGPFGEEGAANLIALCQGYGGRAVASALIRTLHLVTMREALENLLGDDPSNLRKLGISQIGAARRLIHADLGRPWTLDEMARSVSMSRSVFARKFHAIIGKTPYRYLAGIRLEKARELIDGGASVSEASTQVGYSSPAAFARAFRRYAGRPATRRGQYTPAGEERGQ